MRVYGDITVETFTRDCITAHTSVTASRSASTGRRNGSISPTNTQNNNKATAHVIAVINLSTSTRLRPATKLSGYRCMSDGDSIWLMEQEEWKRYESLLAARAYTQSRRHGKNVVPAHPSILNTEELVELTRFYKECVGGGRLPFLLPASPAAENSLPAADSDKGRANNNMMNRSISPPFGAKMLQTPVASSSSGNYLSPTHRLHKSIPRQIISTYCADRKHDMQKVPQHHEQTVQSSSVPTSSMLRTTASTQPVQLQTRTIFCCLCGSILQPDMWATLASANNRKACLPCVRSQMEVYAHPSAERRPYFHRVSAPAADVPNSRMLRFNEWSDYFDTANINKTFRSNPHINAGTHGANGQAYNTSRQDISALLSTQKKLADVRFRAEKRRLRKEYLKMVKRSFRGSSESKHNDFDNDSSVNVGSEYTQSVGPYAYEHTEDDYEDDRVRSYGSAPEDIGDVIVTVESCSSSSNDGDDSGHISVCLERNADGPQDESKHTASANVSVVDHPAEAPVHQAGSRSGQTNTKSHITEAEGQPVRTQASPQRRQSIADMLSAYNHLDDGTDSTIADMASVANTVSTLRSQRANIQAVHTSQQQQQSAHQGAPKSHPDRAAPNSLPSGHQVQHESARASGTSNRSSKLSKEQLVTEVDELLVQWHTFKQTATLTPQPRTSSTASPNASPNKELSSLQKMSPSLHHNRRNTFVVRPEQVTAFRWIRSLPELLPASFGCPRSAENEWSTVWARGMLEQYYSRHGRARRPVQTALLTSEFVLPLVESTVDIHSGRGLPPRGLPFLSVRSTRPKIYARRRELSVRLEPIELFVSDVEPVFVVHNDIGEENVGVSTLIMAGGVARKVILVIATEPREIFRLQGPDNDYSDKYDLDVNTLAEVYVDEDDIGGGSVHCGTDANANASTDISNQLVVQVSDNRNLRTEISATFSNRRRSNSSSEDAQQEIAEACGNTSLQTDASTSNNLPSMPQADTQDQGREDARPQKVPVNTHTPPRIRTFSRDPDQSMTASPSPAYDTINIRRKSLTLSREQRATASSFSHRRWRLQSPAFVLTLDEDQSVVDTGSQTRIQTQHTQSLLHSQHTDGVSRRSVTVVQSPSEYDINYGRMSSPASSTPPSVRSPKLKPCAYRCMCSWTDKEWAVYHKPHLVARRFTIDVNPLSAPPQAVDFSKVVDAPVAGSPFSAGDGALYVHTHRFNITNLQSSPLRELFEASGPPEPRIVITEPVQMPIQTEVDRTMAADPEKEAGVDDQTQASSSLKVTESTVKPGAYSLPRERPILVFPHRTVQPQTLQRTNSAHKVDGEPDLPAATSTDAVEMDIEDAHSRSNMTSINKLVRAATQRNIRGAQASSSGLAADAASPGNGIAGSHPGAHLKANASSSDKHMLSTLKRRNTTANLLVRTPPSTPTTSSMLRKTNASPSTTATTTSSNSSSKPPKPSTNSETSTARRKTIGTSITPTAMASSARNKASSNTSSPEQQVRKQPTKDPTTEQKNVQQDVVEKPLPLIEPESAPVQVSDLAPADVSFCIAVDESGGTSPPAPPPLTSPPPIVSEPVFSTEAPVPTSEVQSARYLRSNRSLESPPAIDEDDESFPGGTGTSQVNDEGMRVAASAQSQLQLPMRAMEYLDMRTPSPPPPPPPPMSPSIDPSQDRELMSPPLSPKESPPEERISYQQDDNVVAESVSTTGINRKLVGKQPPAAAASSLKQMIHSSTTKAAAAVNVSTDADNVASKGTSAFRAKLLSIKKRNSLHTADTPPAGPSTKALASSGTAKAKQSSSNQETEGIGTSAAERTLRIDSISVPAVPVAQDPLPKVAPNTHVVDISKRLDFGVEQTAPSSAQSRQAPMRPPSVPHIGPTRSAEKPAHRHSASLQEAKHILELLLDQQKFSAESLAERGEMESLAASLDGIRARVNSFSSYDVGANAANSFGSLSPVPLTVETPPRHKDSGNNDSTLSMMSTNSGDSSNNGTPMKPTRIPRKASSGSNTRRSVKDSPLDPNVDSWGSGSGSDTHSAASVSAHTPSSSARTPSPSVEMAASTPSSSYLYTDILSQAISAALEESSSASGSPRSAPRSAPRQHPPPILVSGENDPDRAVSEAPVDNPPPSLRRTSTFRAPSLTLPSLMASPAVSPRSSQIISTPRSLSSVFGAITEEDDAASSYVTGDINVGLKVDPVKHVPLTIITADDSDEITAAHATRNKKAEDKIKSKNEKDQKPSSGGAKMAATSSALVANDNWSYFPIPHFGSGQGQWPEGDTPQSDLDAHAPPSVLETYYESFLRQHLSAHNQVHPYSLRLTSEQRIVFALFQMCGRPDVPVAASIR
jgi:hypothetical protein